MSEYRPIPELSDSAQQAIATLAAMRRQTKAPNASTVYGESAFHMLTIHPEPIKAMELADMSGRDRKRGYQMCPQFEAAGLLIRDTNSDGSLAYTYRPSERLVPFAAQYNRLFGEHVRFTLGNEYSIGAIAMRGLKAFAAVQGAPPPDSEQFAVALGKLHANTGIHPQVIVHRGMTMMATGHGVLDLTKRLVNHSVVEATQANKKGPLA